MKQQTSLPASNRPSPTDSATAYPVGTTLPGNDGRYWEVKANKTGSQRWVPVSNQPPAMTYKFEIGDKVKVVHSGIGCNVTELDRDVIIIEKGIYCSNTPGYRVEPPIGNSIKNQYGTYSFDGMISEKTFELVEPVKTTKPTKNMAKVKSITKKTTQEVRTIETSLINKEEVFKMLALAEATGLPLLLVGEPGVNSK